MGLVLMQFSYLVDASLYFIISMFEHGIFTAETSPCTAAATMLPTRSLIERSGGPSVQELPKVTRVCTALFLYFSFC